MMRKLSARPTQASPLGPNRNTQRGGLQRMQDDLPSVPEVDPREKAKKKELEAMKARIVAQMAEKNETEDERENVPPRVDRTVRRSVDPPVAAIARPTHSAISRPPPPPVSKPLPPPMSKPLPPPIAPPSSLGSSVARDGQALRTGLTGFDAAAQVLSAAFDAKDRQRLFRDPREDPSLPLLDEKVFIVSWVDYCNKYGMGYALTDGSVGVHFNDTTSMVLSPDKQ